jgi:hypothetical protein
MRKTRHKLRRNNGRPMPRGAEKDSSEPKKPLRPSSYSEGENESPKLVEVEPVEVERETPETENEPVERGGLDETGSPIFEE